MGYALTVVDLVLIHPPVALPSEPPLGVALLAARLRAAGLKVVLIDANIEALAHLLEQAAAIEGRTRREQRALSHGQRALDHLRSSRGFEHPDRYQAAVKTLHVLADRFLLGRLQAWRRR